jgi:hypothetical protein
MRFGGQRLAEGRYRVSVRGLPGIFTNRGLHLLSSVFLCGVLCWAPPAAAQRPPSLAGLAFIGTLDKKLLVYDENKEEVAGEIALQGIPRQTVLSHDQTKLILLTAGMAVETVDLVARKMTSHFDLADKTGRIGQRYQAKFTFSIARATWPSSDGSTSSSAELTAHKGELRLGGRLGVTSTYKTRARD